MCYPNIKMDKWIKKNEGHSSTSLVPPDPEGDDPRAPMKIPKHENVQVGGLQRRPEARPQRSGCEKLRGSLLNLTSTSRPQGQWAQETPYIPLSENVHGGGGAQLKEAWGHAQEVKTSEMGEGHWSTSLRPPDLRAEAAGSPSKTPK